MGTAAVAGILVIIALIGVAQSIERLWAPSPLSSGQSHDAVENPTGLWAVEYRWGDPAPGYKQVDATRLESWQHVRIENRGEVAAYRVVAQVMDTPSSVTVPDSTVTVGDVPAGGSAWSADTFTIRVDSGQGQDPCAGLTWRIEYDDATGMHHAIENVPQFPSGEGPCP
jgi:hypothetical protein